MDILNSVIGFVVKRTIIITAWFYSFFGKPVVPISNFEPEKYLGEWHELYSKPQSFQTNSQATALYTAVPGDPTKVIVKNTQDVSDTILGEATIGAEYNTSTSGQRGTLWVSFGKTIKFPAPYWIVYAVRDPKTQQYVMSVVSDPFRFTFWTLVRTGYKPTLDDHIQLGKFIAQFYSYKAFDV